MIGRTPVTEWCFLIDENLGRQVATYLVAEGSRGEHVSDALFPGADDFEDILPYARKEDLIVVTNDVLGFKPLSEDQHEGIVIVYNQRLSPWSIATGLFRLIERYSDRGSLPGTEVLDPYVE
ncbi:DUF5615 family PIN-like protein [Natronorarus salvus]|uniref:DUF5615 family PIN-like protein n=1 Tax=Natronorarus salvus TaxID=3117733 RepID=UPI002F269A88